MKIKAVETEFEKKQLDDLLWDTLWKPFDFPRNIRASFKLDGCELELIAVENNCLLGGVVAIYLPENEVEIRHIAINENHQKSGVGRSLIEELINQLKKEEVKLIKTIARNTSEDFFKKMGFKSDGEYLTHPDFIKFGIKFRGMSLNLCNG